VLGRGYLSLTLACFCLEDKFLFSTVAALTEFAPNKEKAKTAATLNNFSRCLKLLSFNFLTPKITISNQIDY
jgi:hypothetical protein